MKQYNKTMQKMIKFDGVRKTNENEQTTLAQKLLIIHDNFYG